MLAQLTSPVQWVSSVDYMTKNGVEEFLEIGPKDVLTGLIRRIGPDRPMIGHVPVQDHRDVLADGLVTAVGLDDDSLE